VVLSISLEKSSSARDPAGNSALMPSMPELLIDTTRLVGRLMAGPVTDRYRPGMLAYVQRYAPVARLVLRKGRLGVVLPRASSRCLSSLLLEHADKLSACVANIVAKSDWAHWPRSGHSGRVLLNLGHSGPEQPQYGEWLRRRKLRPYSWCTT